MGNKQLSLNLFENDFLITKYIFTHLSTCMMALFQYLYFGGDIFKMGDLTHKGCKYCSKARNGIVVIILTNQKPEKC